MLFNRILYITILSSSLTFTYFFGGTIPYTLLFAILLLPVLSLLYSLFILVRFKYSQNISNKFIIKGDIVDFTLNLANQDLLIYPFLKAIFYGEKTIYSRQTENLSLSLPPHSIKSFTFSLKCKYRGNYTAGLKALEIYDLLGIFILRYKVRETFTLSVNPKIIHLDSFGLNPNYITDSNNQTNSAIQDMTTISDIRKYAFGDTMKKIHWKLSARYGSLHVKEFQNSSLSGAVLMTDMSKNLHDNDTNNILEDKMIECAVSISDYCLHKQIPLTFLYYSGEIKELHASNYLDFDLIYNFLSKSTFSHEIGLKDILEIYIPMLVNTTNIIIITAKIDADLPEIIYKMQVAGFFISLIKVSTNDLKRNSVMNSNNNADIDSDLSWLSNAGVRVYNILPDDDIKAILEGRYS